MIFSRLWPWVAFVVVGLACLAVGTWLRVIYTSEWMAPDTTQQPPGLRPWMVEADCYSQLARCQRILDGQGLLQNHFTVENWPEGLIPSTTAPFDYVILLLYFLFWPFTKHPLDWAGAVVSPALWVVLGMFWTFIRSREFNLTARALLLIGASVMPQFLWATAFGRPRHQSLIVVLMAMALTAEYERWQIELTPKRAWNIFAGIVWGLACWTSLFEPMLVAACLIVYNLAVRRRENPAFLVSFGLVLLAMTVLEGGHIFGNVRQIISLRHSSYVVNWLASIAEVQPFSFAAYWNVHPGPLLLFALIFAVMAFLAWTLRSWKTGGNATDGLLILLTILLLALMFAQRRWGYYAALTELFVVVRFCEITPLPWSRLAVIALALVGIVTADKIRFDERDLSHPQQPSLQMAQIAHAIDAPGGIMAPWWISPGLLYFSGQPIVSGSSHAGISGIVASAKFYTATSWTSAERILKERKVRWVVVWDDTDYVYPLYDTSAQILDTPLATDDAHGFADNSIAQLLIIDQLVPTSLRLRGVTSQMKLYEYVPDAQ